MNEHRYSLIRTGELAAVGIIFAPASFKLATLSTKAKICNGCGAANAKFDFVPDTIYGLYIGYACHIHDWMYHEGRTIEDKEEADRVFRNNVLRIIKRYSKWYHPEFLMRRRAQLYYKGVDWFGGPAFWEGKN